MTAKRPVNLDLTKMKFPLTAITSILHRISGVLLFIFMPIVLWALATSLSSEQGFAYLHRAMEQCFFFQLMVWAMVSCLFYHLVAGIRHLIMDLGFGETPCTAKITAIIMLLVFVVLAVLVGVWVW